jgi:hypothetical protein
MWNLISHVCAAVRLDLGLVVEGALTAAGSGEQVVPASDYRALQSD